jgi:hypothetical protein
MQKDDEYLYYTRQEIQVLEDMLYKLKLKERLMIKKNNHQGWWDYLWEWLGY